MSDDGIVDPLTFEIVDRDNVDGLLEMYSRLDKQDKELYAAKNAIRQAIGELAAGTTKTRRVRGKAWQCVVEMPDSSWEQAILREAYHSYPSIRDEYLKIGTIDVRKREYKKLLEMTGPADLENFKRMLKGAERPPTGLPRLTIEKSPHGEVIVPEPNQSELF